MAVDGNGLYPLARWRSKLFTTSTTFVVPADVGCIWIDACGGGSGGSGGHNNTTGYGGCGGAPGMGVTNHLLMVTPGDTLTLTVGAGSDGAAAGSNSAAGGTTSVIPATSTPSSQLRAPCLGYAQKGTVSDGGRTINGAGSWYGATTRLYPRVACEAGLGYSPGMATSVNVMVGGVGGAPNTNGGASGPFGSGIMQSSLTVSGSIYSAGGTATTDLGGGGAGGHTPWGIGGAGGNGGAAGANATGYGAGGGGGGGNGAGGNGAPGFICLYMLTAYNI